MDDVAWLALYRHGLSPSPRAGARGAGSGRSRAVWRGITTGVYLAAMMVMTSHPGMAWARSDADDVFEILVHPELPTILHLPDAVTRARVTGSSIRVTFAGRTLHVRPSAGVSAGLEALLEVETATMLLTFRLRVVERSEDARDELVVVAMQSEQRAEESPPDGEAAPEPAASPGAATPAAGEPVADTSPEIPVHERVTTFLLFPDEIVRARFTTPVTGMMRATTFDKTLLIRPISGLSIGTEIPVSVQTATVRQRFRLRVVSRAADAWRQVVVLAPAAGDSPATPTPTESPATTTPGMLARAVRMMIERFTVRDADAWGPMPVASTTGHGGAPATERAGAAARPRRVDISIHAVAAPVGTTGFHVAGYESTNARQSHRVFGMRVAAHPHDTWAVEGSVTGEWPAAPTLHTGTDVIGAPELEAIGPRLRADVGLRGRLGTTLIPTLYAGIGLQAHHLDIEAGDSSERDAFTSDFPFESVLALGLGLEYRAGDVLLGIELHVRQGLAGGYRSVAPLVSVGYYLDQGE